MTYILISALLTFFLTKSRGGLLVLNLFIISLILGFRLEANADYLNYYHDFWIPAQESTFLEVITSGPVFVFVLINKVFSWLGLTFVELSYFVTLFACFSTYFIYKLTNYRYSFLVTVPSLVFVLSATQIRQSLALSFFIFGLYLVNSYVKKNLYLASIFVILFSSFLHFSILVFLPVTFFLSAPPDFVASIVRRSKNIFLLRFSSKFSYTIIYSLLFIVSILLYCIPIALSRVLYYQDHSVAASTAGALLRLVPLNLTIVFYFLFCKYDLISPSKISNIFIGSVFLLILMSLFFPVSPLTSDRLTWYIYPGLCFYLSHLRLGNIISALFGLLFTFNILFGATFATARQSAHLFL